MDSIILENFRCFRDEQTARLAPLTLLVGENSTGKTSFMAVMRALWDIAYRLRLPDFKEEPYDLGSFDEIAHHRGGRGGRAQRFSAGFNASSIAGESRKPGITSKEPFHMEVDFGKRGTAPAPVRIHRSHRDLWLEEHLEQDQSYVVRIGNNTGKWERNLPNTPNILSGIEEQHLPPFYHYFLSSSFHFVDEDEDDSYDTEEGEEEDSFRALEGSPQLDHRSRSRFFNLAFEFGNIREERPYASAPVRSKPRRTYDPSRPTQDPEGDHIPMYLANLSFLDAKRWPALKERLEGFGKHAGLFNEVSIKHLGRRGSEPFQLQIRGVKGPQRNLIDVGYGVSQVLPVVTELLREDAPPLFLLQQPEVHLHPSAQAALGSLFCQVASRHRQLVVETHSDHLMDRVRMEVRDGTTSLKPADVSILYFERGDLDVQIHSLRIGEDGEILKPPASYRRFFMEETTKSLWGP